MNAGILMHILIHIKYWTSSGSVLVEVYTLRVLSFFMYMHEPL